LVIYSVSVIIKREFEEEWFDWMLHIHIQNVLKTGFFSGYKIYKTIIPSTEGDNKTYVIQYECKSIDDYLAYKENFAASMQREHAKKFAGKIATARIVMEEVE